VKVKVVVVVVVVVVIVVPEVTPCFIRGIKSWWVVMATKDRPDQTHRLKTTSLEGGGGGRRRREEGGRREGG